MSLWIAMTAGLALAVLSAVMIYNRPVRARNLVEEAWSGIEVQLKRRTHLLPNLMETVKGNLQHERGVLEQVTKLRAQSLSAATVVERASVEGAMSRALGTVFAVAENYPDLKANQNFLDLQRTLTGLEVNQLHKSLSREYERIYFAKKSEYMLPGLIFSVVVGSLLIVRTPEPLLAGFLALWLSFWSMGCALLGLKVLQAWRISRRGGLSRRIFGKFSAVGITLFALPFWAANIVVFGIFAYTVSLLGALVLGLLGAVHALFYHLLKAPSHLGRKILDQIEGFRLYLSVAEKERLGILHPPEKTPEHFEKYLPYALALNVEQEWSEPFADFLKTQSDGAQFYQPGWYKGLDAMGFGSRHLAAWSNSLASGLAGAIASAASPPGSGSGSGGGGSSGGGEGGGGASGW
ncbi:MAG: LemA family protein [Desulfosoma sp.]|uniref:LemA family protein n=1 Tax=Desulfosoma sp. TaxID=2603217 RepID=UPI00404AB0EF